MKSAILSFGMILCMVSIASAQTTATLKVQIQDIESDEGMLRVGLYDSAQNWLEKTFKSKSSTIVDGKCEVVFDNVPYGFYGISVYHDENNNGKMDKYLGFYPKENYACSNQAPAKYGPPEWKDAKFIINQKTNQQLIKL
ncbi:DUF2141 domain-containing protein [Flagellimonas algicola]|uniref:DUF2141 domain-containing protein n=1 Tax=Flagellimonas algicola TaxID=2583815 RepID=A0ABY2WQQ6_9FLAO|nr:DUF2141 domain-containing protein [Allomuricauda algicola]TMU56982.1 DUF2141 domain-containing protein [Allomuricauda algicola]